MRYRQPENTIDENDEEVYYEGRPRTISDQTAFMKWSTEIEPVGSLVDKSFMKRNRNRILDINKVLPLSFIDDPRSIKLFRLRRMNMTLATDAGLIDLADETTLDNLADYQTTRGIRGNYQNALITQRKEWKDRTDAENKKGMFGRLIGKRNDQVKQYEMGETFE